MLRRRILHFGIGIGGVFVPAVYFISDELSVAYGQCVPVLYQFTVVK
jgi:hypothetical protein